MAAARPQYRGDLPGGAQTWEIPLHTPDILAAAHRVELCVQGYEVTRDVEWLEDAEYWAWTGVPFVYLVPPTPGPLGLYAPIPVYGATHWKAPVWFGLPVHWYGLVYVQALYNLSRYDSTGLWRKIANGIVASSLQAIWPLEDPRRGPLAGFRATAVLRAWRAGHQPCRVGSRHGALFLGPRGPPHGVPPTEFLDRWSRRRGRVNIQTTPTCRIAVDAAGRRPIESLHLRSPSN